MLSENATTILNNIKSVGDRFQQSSRESTAILVQAEKEFEDFKLFKR